MANNDVERPAELHAVNAFAVTIKMMPDDLLALVLFNDGIGSLLLQRIKPPGRRRGLDGVVGAGPIWYGKCDITSCEIIYH